MAETALTQPEPEVDPHPAYDGQGFWLAAPVFSDQFAGRRGSVVRSF